MTATRNLSLAIPLLSLLALPVSAQDIDLSEKVAPGKWALAYQRTGELKPLSLKRKENGTSYTCIDGDARDKIIDWITSKGCSVGKEAMVNDVYRMEGECRLKWWKSRAIPVSVELRPASTKQFSLVIRTLDDSLLGFSERTTASHQGACDPVSATKTKKDQGTKT